MRIGLRIIGGIFIGSIGITAFTQPKLEFQIKKPREFEERKLGSEKMADKKFTPPRHFFQNMYTHYNYYFNAKNRLQDIIIAAKSQHQEDYSKLLPFYNYTFDNTSQSSEIDSVIQKCTAGILLHDLRNDWIDNLYILLGRAYLLRKDYDSAAMTFQYVNYAFGPKEKDGYDLVIGSNSDGGNVFSIATKETTNFYKKLVELPPSRNESFIWQIRTHTEKGEYIDAASLITTLKNDPGFPTRLQEELAEVEAYNYYKQNIYDSSARHLSKAITVAENNSEKSRWYYLLGQMCQLAGQRDSAAGYFAKCAKITVDPVMEVYARLAAVRLRKNDDPAVVQQNIHEIIKMAKKEKYELYQDIIYYAAALIELERNNYDKAEEYLTKSVKYNTDNIEQKSKSFLLLADLNFDQKKYGKAANYYDSLNMQYLDSALAKRVDIRKPSCRTIYENERIIFAQDSLLKIAAMPENDRNIYIKALAKRLRKERGLKEIIDNNTGLTGSEAQIGKGPSNLFGDNQSEFYFYNVSLRSNGFQLFKQKWGNRPNTDNWRRSSSIRASFVNNENTTKTDITNNTNTSTDINKLYHPTELTVDELSSNLPLGEAKEKAANQSINIALFEKGKTLENQLEDYPEAIKIYELLMTRLDKNSEIMEELLFNLVYCYNRIGDRPKADIYKNKLNNEYKNGEFTKRMNMPAIGNEKANPAATAKYKEIYSLFIEGNFEKAVQEKKTADSIFGTNYWTPQLLYIESIFYIKQKQDSIAIQKLRTIISSFAKSPLVPRAQTLIDVVSRRKEIETYLTQLNIVRLKEDTFIVIKSDPPVNKNNPVITSPVNTPRKDTLVKIPPPVLPKTPFTIDTAVAQMVGIVLHRVDVVYFNECLNAFNRYNQQNLYHQKFELQKFKLNNDYAFVMINSNDFTSASKAMEYIAKVKPKAATHIVPWLEPDKFSFIIISQANLDLLKQTLDFPGYLKTLKAVIPGKFQSQSPMSE